VRVLIQRVSRASVRVEGCEVGAIGRGLLLLTGIGRDDTPEILAPMAKKIVNLRIFPGPGGDSHFDRSALDEGVGLLAVSQFTLYADCRKGRRPSFSHADEPDRAGKMFDAFIQALARYGLAVQTGEFGALMNVELVNDGPVTIWLDSEEALSRR